MKTLVVFDLDGSLVSILLSELATVPAEGRSYVFEGRRYKVVETIEFLGSRTVTGEVTGGSAKLLSMLKAVYGDDVRVAALLSGMKSVGSSNAVADNTTSGGIILPERKVAEEFDHVLFVRVKKTSNEAAPAVKLAKLQAVTGGNLGKLSLVEKPTSRRRQRASNSSKRS